MAGQSIIFTKLSDLSDLELSGTIKAVKTLTFTLKHTFTAFIFLTAFFQTSERQYIRFFYILS